MKFSNRTQFLINRKFQLSFLAYMITMATVVIAVFYAANVFFFWKFFKKGKDLGLADDHVFFRFLAEQKMTMNWIFIATALIALVFLVLYGLFLSNRVAGPMYRLQKHLTEVVDGKTVADFHFREKDYFQEVAVTFNQFLKHYRDRLK